MKKIYFITLFCILNPFLYSQWFIQSTFTPSQTIYAVKFFNQNTGYCVSVLYNSSTNNVYKTTNGGANWLPQSSGYTATRFMSIFILHPDTVFMSGNNGLIIKTVNGGANWVTKPTGITDQLWGLYFVNSFTGYTCGGTGRIMKTTDKGELWVTQASPTMTSLSCVYFTGETTGYISGYTIVLKTTNSGADWINMNAPFINPFENFREIKFTDALTGYYVSDLGRILKTTNAGVNWDLMTTGTTEALFAIDFTDPNTAFVCGNAGTVLKTTDAGSTWLTQSSGLSEILPDISFTNAMTGYISAWTGKILKTTNGGVTFLTQIGSEIPADFILGQNYPNPFNPATKIKFSIPSADENNNGFVSVSLSVFDISGKETIKLAGGQFKPGNYEVTWNAGDVSSGIYYYTLRACNYSITRKMIHIK